MVLVGDLLVFRAVEANIDTASIQQCVDICKPTKSPEAQLICQIVHISNLIGVEHQRGGKQVGGKQVQNCKKRYLNC